MVAGRQLVPEHCAIERFVLLLAPDSYGEIAPFSTNAGRCELHNQTMTVTTLVERCDASAA